MLVRFFERSDISRFMGLMMLFLLLFWKSFFLNVPTEGECYLSRFRVADFSPQIRVSISLFIIFLMSILLFFFSNGFKLIKNDSILVPAVYILLLGLLPSYTFFPGLYLFQLLMLLMLFFLFRMQKDFYFESLFWGMFILGILSQIDIVFVYLSPVLWVFLWLKRMLNLRSLLISITGLLFPFFLYFVYQYFFLEAESIAAYEGYGDFVFSFSGRRDKWLIIILILMLFVSIFQVFANLSRYLIQVRNDMILLSMISSGILFFSLFTSGAYVVTALLPASFLLAKMLEMSGRSLWKDISFAVLFLLAFFTQLFHLNFL